VFADNLLFKNILSVSSLSRRDCFLKKQGETIDLFVDFLYLAGNAASSFS